MRFTKEETIPPSCLRVLAVIMNNMDYPLDLRSIGKKLGVSKTFINNCIERLVEAGLISYERNKVGTLRVNCQFDPLKEINHA